jgi:hypothetical protein
MPRGRSEALVTKFLRDVLAVEAVGVPELEAKARAGGLLGERQSITTAKVFRAIRRPSKWSQKQHRNVAFQFQAIGSKGSPVSTPVVRPMTSLGTVGANS